MVVGQGSPQLHIRYRSHMQRKAMNGKNKETETCQGTHTHTHVSIYVHTLLCYCCWVVPVCSVLSDSLQPHGP